MDDGVLGVLADVAGQKVDDADVSPGNATGLPHVPVTALAPVGGATSKAST